MRRFAILVVLLGLSFLASNVRAERPPQSRDKATLVVSGTVKTITSKKSPYVATDDPKVRLGTLTEYTAEIVVESIEKGGRVRVGDTIKVSWFHVTELTGIAFGGAVGHGYPFKEKSRGKFWLVEGKDCWTIIYNKDGVEIIKK